MIDNIKPNLEFCPICNAEVVPLSEQPIASTHAYSILFKCGNTVDIIIGYNEYVVNKNCRNKGKGKENEY